MSSIANIVAFDGATPPVSHTFNPISIRREGKANVAFYREALVSVPVYAQPRVTLSQFDRSGGGVYRNEVLVEVPVMESVTNANSAGYTAAPKVAYINSVKGISMAHERSDIAGRRLVRQLAINIFGNVSTSVVPVVTGPTPELWDLQIMPT